MTLPDEPARPGPLTARGSLPVLALYLLAAVIYAVASRAIKVPIIFPDEFTYGHIAQSIANGDGVSWRSDPQNARSLLYMLAIAPSWIASSGYSAYEVAKTLNAVMVCLVVVPVWALARSLVGSRLALLPAILSVAGSWMLTTGFLLTENLAFPLAVASLAAMVASLRSPGSRWWIVALGLATFAAYARTQLVMLVPIFLVASLVDGARVGSGKTRDRLLAHRWPLGVAAGASFLALLVAVSSPTALGAYAGVRHFSPGLGSVLSATGQHALALIVIGGFLPATLVGALALRAENWRDDTTGPVLAVLLSATTLLALQSGWFGAGFHLRWDIERYVAYVLPLAFVAMVLAPGRITVRAGLTASGTLALCLLLTNNSLNVVEQRGVGGTVHRLGQLIPAFGDHPALGLAVAGAVIASAGVLLAARPPARLISGRSVPAVAGLVLVVLLAQSQTSWHTEHLISQARRAVQPADISWVDHAAHGPVGILNTNLDNPNLYVTELFNEKIQGRYHVQSGLAALGPLCLVTVEATGGLRGPAGCAPPRTLLLESSFTRVTFDGERLLGDNLPNSRLVDAGDHPRVLSLVTLPCVEPGSAFRGSNLAVRACSGRLDLQLWPTVPGVVTIRFQGGLAQHYGRLNAAGQPATVYNFKPEAVETIRIPVGGEPSTLGLQLDWSTTAGAPTLLSIQLRRGGQVTNLL